MFTCKVCGSAVEAGQAFCTKCGAKKTLELNSVQKAFDFLEVQELHLE